ncbi:uro-adherence factor A [Enoplosus armatus]|uniref:uro-adherence factor A n=1 Tax=Enoplosus armatus TaxID=215367 RepID=UPI0039917ED6
MEEEQESTEDIKNSFDLVVEEEQETEEPLVEPVIQESGLLFEEEEGKLSVDSMKTGIEHSEQEFETDVGLTDETEKTTKELQDGTEELLVEFEIDEGLCDSKETDAAGDGSETTGAAATENRTPSLLEEDAGIDMEETAYGVEEEAAEDEMQNKNEMEILNLQVAGMAAELTTEGNEKENALIAESESSGAEESDEALEISNEEMTAESKPKDLTIISTEEMVSEGSYAEETVSSISARQDVIDDEILDLWIQTALSEDTDGIKQQQGLEPGQHMDTEIELPNEEQDEIPSVQTELVESKSGDSELVSDTEMSSSTVESGFLDQSLSELGTQNNETQLLTSTSTGSFQGMHYMLANMSESADISELSTQQPNSASQDILMEETAEYLLYLREEESITETGFHPDSLSSEVGHLNQESDKSQDKEISAEVTDLAWKTDPKDTEEAVVKSLTKRNVLFKVEETKVEDEPLEITVCDSQDGIKHTQSGQSRSSSEASLEEGIVSTESGSQGDACTESEKKLLKLPSLDKPQPGWSEDVAGSSDGLNRVPTTESEDQMEVDASALDFTAQRSRIAVKNPRVRPPKDPRSLLHMPSVDPTPSPHLPVKVPAGVPLGGLGIGMKLPGLGAGFPALKKTQWVVRDENSQETLSQEPETKEESDTLKQNEAQHKPKWMPPKHPGFGNPLMSELKAKLKKTTKE